MKLPNLKLVAICGCKACFGWKMGKTTKGCSSYVVVYAFQIERLRKEGNRILEEAQEKLREDLKKKASLHTVTIDSDSDSQDTPTAKLKVGTAFVN